MMITFIYILDARDDDKLEFCFFSKCWKFIVVRDIKEAHSLVLEVMSRTHGEVTH